MYSKAKQASYLFLPALLFGMLFLAACENDLNKIKEISALQVSQPIDTTRGVEVIYSDSAVVKGKMTTPLMIHYATEKPYYKMPIGVKIIFYDVNGREDGNIVADSAINRDKEQIIEFHKNVVCTNAKGETFKSDELIWNQAQKIIYSNKPVQLTTPTGDILNGVSFKSDDKLQHPIMGNSTGAFNVSENPAN
jgi:LPS export ABC transporter protein LptC